jgi:hypothetical protein
MRRHQNDVLARRETQQARAQDRPRGEVERLLRRFVRQAARLAVALVGRELAQVRERERERERGRDDLDGTARRLAVSRPKDFVPADDFVERLFERRDAQVAVEANRHRDVVERVAPVELVYEPEALLAERERQFALARGAHERRRLNAPARAHRRLDRLGEARDRRGFKEAVDGQFDLERVARARDDLRRQERVAAQLEEVVVDADALRAEHLRPRRGQNLLDRRARRDVFGLRLGARAVGRGQALAVNLPVRRQRHRV